LILVIASWLVKQKKGPLRAPKKLALSLLAVVVRVGRQCYQPAIKGEGLELDGEADSFLVRKRGSYLGPLLAGLAVVLVLFDGEDVEVRVGGGFCGCWGP
jgi:hypothetical protein